MSFMRAGSFNNTAPPLLLLTVLAGQPKFKSIAEAPKAAAIAALSAKVSGLLPSN